MAQPPVQLSLPESLRSFHLFPCLPYDIRHLIWEEAIYTRGIHFLKFAKTRRAQTDPASGSGPSSSNNGTAAETPQTEASSPRDPRSAGPSNLTATLQPVFPLPAADRSYYITMSKTFTRLSYSCKEARRLVERLILRTGNLTLANGRIVMLHQSPDVVCIDYPDMERGQKLGKWAENLDLDQLARIRKLAIKYTTLWDAEPRLCTTCGRIHQVDPRNTKPRHCWEFLALFKNLREFYFVDYLAVRNLVLPEDSHDSFRTHYATYASGEGGRTYYELDPETHTIHSKVYLTLSWLRQQYIDYCRKTGKGPARPEEVRFDVLACAWDPGEALAPCGAQEPRKPAREKRPFGSSSRTSATTATSNTWAQDQLPQTTLSSPKLPVVFGDQGVSRFDFTMDVKQGRPNWF
ncbi:hypothetical protein F4780DRAFT_768507 [Xylariomycetidae sp. FL0641]|nr:hypothetical protein F4780DRAFT_768507 [Xylariomycetidae sp. FL0641]